MRLGKYLSSLTKPELEELKEQLNLTESEAEVFKMLSVGKSNTNIADKICVCERTVTRISRKISIKIEKIGRDIIEWYIEIFNWEWWTLPTYACYTRLEVGVFCRNLDKICNCWYWFSKKEFNNIAHEDIEQVFDSPIGYYKNWFLSNFRNPQKPSK